MENPSLQGRDLNLFLRGGDIYVQGDVSEERLALMDAILTWAQENDVLVVGFFPPVMPSLYDEMQSAGVFDYATLASLELKELFNQYGFFFYDYSDPAVLQAENIHFLDGWHFSELIHLRLYYELVEQVPALAQYSDPVYLEQLLAEIDALLPPSLDPLSESEGYVRRALAFRRLEDYEAALVDLNLAVQLNSDNGEAYYQRALVFRSQGNREAALADFDRAVELGFDNPAIYLQRGVLLRQLDDLDAALVDLNRYVSLVEDDANAYWQRAQIYIEQDNIEAALVDLQRHVEPGWRYFASQRVFDHR